MRFGSLKIDDVTFFAAVLVFEKAMTALQLDGLSRLQARAVIAAEAISENPHCEDSEGNQVSFGGVLARLALGDSRLTIEATGRGIRLILGDSEVSEDVVIKSVSWDYFRLKHSEWRLEFEEEKDAYYSVSESPFGKIPLGAVEELPPQDYPGGRIDLIGPMKFWQVLYQS